MPEQVQPWWTFRDELAILDGVVPTSMCGDMLKRLHVSHQGIEATLRRAGQTMFWHGMAVYVKQNIANCITCRKDAPEQTKETLHSHSIADKPWKKVGMDIFTHKSINYLVITDYFSDYFEGEKIADMTASSVIDISKRCFSRPGIPISVHSDNGIQFTAREFAMFSAE